jgi:flagellar hook-basal body complex protein FliE
MTAPIRPDAISPRSLELDRATQSLPRLGDDSASFTEVFKRVVNDAGALQDEAKDLIGAFLRGEPVELHQVVAASEEAGISLQLLVELRNKLTDAYRAVMNLQ